MVREGATTWSFTRSCETHSSRAACPSSSASTTCRSPGALQRGRLHHKPVLGEEQFQARAARSAPGQSCCHSRIGWSNPAPTPGLTAGRVNGEKKHSGSDAARTASLPDLRRWPGDAFFGMKPNSFFGRCRAGAAGGRARTHWANLYWASHQTRLGRAIKQGWASQY